MKGEDLIANERAAQRRKWEDAHDDRHDRGELAIAAAEVAIHGTGAQFDFNGEAYPKMWATELAEKHEGDRVRQLAIAGALIAAEIDRLLRADPGRR